MPVILDEVSDIDGSKPQELACFNCRKPRRLAGRMIANPRYGYAEPLRDLSWPQQRDEVVTPGRIHVLQLPQTSIALSPIKEFENRKFRARPSKIFFCMLAAYSPVAVESRLFTTVSARLEPSQVVSDECHDGLGGHSSTVL